MLFYHPIVLVTQRRNSGCPPGAALPARCKPNRRTHLCTPEEYRQAVRSRTGWSVRPIDASHSSLRATLCAQKSCQEPKRIHGTLLSAFSLQCVQVRRDLRPESTMKTAATTAHWAVQCNDICSSYPVLLLPVLTSLLQMREMPSSRSRPFSPFRRPFLSKQA